MASTEYYRFIEKVRSRPKPENPSVEESRATLEKIGERMQVPPGAAFSQLDAGGIPAEWVTPLGAPAERTILYMHGGGYNYGSVRTHRALAARIAAASAGRVLSIDYRLAPEHPFPAALEDAVSAYRWLRAEGTAPDRLVLAGDSAGGGLALATLIALRDAGDDLPAACVSLSPLTDHAKEGASMKTCAQLDPLVDPESSALNSARYLGPDGDPRHPLASPLYADLRGLPPLLILVGTWEVLLDDSTRMAERARAAAVDVDLRVWDEMIHIWPYYAQFFPEGREAIEIIGQFIRSRTPTDAGATAAAL